MISFSEHILTVRDRDCSVGEQTKRARTMLRFSGNLPNARRGFPEMYKFPGGRKGIHTIYDDSESQTAFMWMRSFSLLCKAASMLQKWYCSSYRENKTLDQIIPQISLYCVIGQYARLCIKCRLGIKWRLCKMQTEYNTLCLTKR